MYHVLYISLKYSLIPNICTSVLDCSLAFRFGKAMMSILAQLPLCRYLSPNPELGTAILRSGRLGTNTKIEDHLYSLYALVLLYLLYRISLLEIQVLYMYRLLR